MSLLEQNITKKRQVNEKNAAKLDVNNNNNNEYKVEAI